MAAGPAWADTTATSTTSADTVTVVVEGTVDGAAKAVTKVGGTVLQKLPALKGVAATVPSSAVTTLKALSGIKAVLPAESFTGAADTWGDDTTNQGLLSTTTTGSWKADHDKNSMFSVAKQTHAYDVWDDNDPKVKGLHLTGAGVGVALIDTGVTPVEGLDAPGQVVDGPDLSLDSQSPNTAHVDGYGHGTHMAGIIAGRDAATNAPGEDRKATNFSGVAPDARIVNVKAGASDGAVDVTQVIAGIDWVVEHKDELGIRVLNLSYGTESVQSYQVDPLADAVENAWKAGIVVVVAAGNDGQSGPHALTMPAIDPYVIAVGSADNNGKDGLNDWSLADWTNSGDATRQPDILAPGKSVVSLRDPGSFTDVTYPTGRPVGDGSGRFFRGSGTSMSAAVVSGAVALVVQANPSLTPDQVKGLLLANTDRIGDDHNPVPVGELNVQKAVAKAVDAATHPDHPVPAYTQSYPRSSGLGSLDASRGAAYLVDPDTGASLTGEQDLLGAPWDAQAWAAASAAGTAWSGGTWRGIRWTGDTWSAGAWPTVAWATPSWTGIAWTDRNWVQKSLASDASWSRVSWRGNDDWSRVSWRGGDWSRVSWRSNTF
jgi:serine protease AprX